MNYLLRNCLEPQWIILHSEQRQGSTPVLSCVSEAENNISLDEDICNFKFTFDTGSQILVKEQLKLFGDNTSGSQFHQARSKCETDLDKILDIWSVWEAFWSRGSSQVLVKKINNCCIILSKKLQRHRFQRRANPQKCHSAISATLNIFSHKCNSEHFQPKVQLWTFSAKSATVNIFSHKCNCEHWAKLQHHLALTAALQGFVVTAQCTTQLIAVCNV